jgi:transposase
LGRIRKPNGRTRQFVHGRSKSSPVAAERVRFQCLIALWRGKSPSDITEVLAVSRATVYRVIDRYQAGGAAALCDLRQLVGPRKVNPRCLTILFRLAEIRPTVEEYGRSTWTTGLLARILKEKTGIDLHFTWVWQLLYRAGYRWKRARPMVRLCNPQRRWQWARLVRVLWQVRPGEVILFEDEADIDLNPKLGHLWCRRGIPAEVETPGKNRKSYLAGALNVDTGYFLYVTGESKRSCLFISLLRKIRGTYRCARKVHVVLDNYSIHRSRVTQQALREAGGRIQIHFLPGYSPQYNPVEHIWQKLHAAVTRNHRYRKLPQLMRAVGRFLDAIGRVQYQSPLPFKVMRHGLVVSVPK